MSTESIPLGDLVEIVGGGTPSRNIPEFWNGGIPWATVKDMTSVELSETQEFISEKGVSTSTTRIVPAGSVIMATRMGLGKVAINKIDLAINQDLKALKCNGKLDPKFLLYFLQSKAEYLESQGKGATVKEIKLDLVRSLPVPRLTLPEQRRIAEILDKADAIRRKRREAIDLLDNFLRSVFLEMFGDEERQGPFIPLHDAVEIISGQVDPRVPPYSEMVLVGGENIESGTGRLLKLKTAQDKRAISGKYLFSGDCILYSKIRPYLNKVVLPDFSGVCSADIYPIVPKKEFLKEFVAFALQTKRFLAYAESCSTRTSIPKINREDLGKYSFPMPSIAKQSLFSQIFNTAQKCRLSLVQSEQETENCFRALSSNIFQGN